MSAAIANAFNDCITARDLDGLVALMTDDHAFVDSAGGTISGKVAAREAWRGFFAAFPDYRNHFDRVEVRGELVAIAGRSTCSVTALAGPALWSARISGDRIAEWRVYDDVPETRSALGL